MSAALSPAFLDAFEAWRETARIYGVHSPEWEAARHRVVELDRNDRYAA